MNAKLYTLLVKLKNLRYFRFVLVVPIVAYLALTVPAYFWQNHLFKNLEPYPDGLLYALSARNLALEGKLALTYQNSVLPYWVPPLYSLVLFVGYLLNSNPSTFYLVNTFLGTLTFVVILAILWKTTKNAIVTLFALTTFLAHAYISFLPTVPMAENLTLLLSATGIWGLLTNKKLSWKKTLLVFGSAVALVYTKSATIFFAVTLSLCGIIQFWPKLSKKYIFALSSGLILTMLLFSVTIANPIVLIQKFSTALFRGNDSFTSLRFFLPNIGRYWQVIGSNQGQFLWLTTPLTSFTLVLTFLTSTIYSLFYSRYQYRTQSLFLLALFLAQFPLQLIFYSVDSRYIIYSILLLSIQVGLLAHSFWLEKKLVWLFALTSVLVVLVVQQLPLFSQLIAANVLGRSTAWQHQAILHFDRYFLNKDDVHLITALPPFLVDSYSSGHFRVLPLSQHQEFIAKEEWVWGNDVPPTYSNEELLELTKTLTKNSEEIYISNAYITHQQSVIADYENYKKKFNLELVSEGCLGACNIYKLAILSDTTINSVTDKN